VPPNDVTPESEARWQAWLAKSRTREARTRRKATVSLLVLVFGTAVVGALVLGLR
jgi:hypothetical protein